MYKSCVHYILKAKKILDWMEKNNRLEPPNVNSNDEEERLLAIYYKDIKIYLLRPIEYLENEDDNIRFNELKRVFNEINKFKKEEDIDMEK